MIKKILLVAVLAFNLSACAMNQIDKEKIGQVKKIGIYSALGPDVNHDHTGTTMFTNTRSRAAVPEWAIDDYIEKRSVALIESKNYAATSLVSAGALRQYNVSTMDMDILFNQAAINQCDTLIVVTPYALPRDMNPLHLYAGYGIMERSIFGLKRYFISAVVSFDAYDVKTRKELAWSTGSPFEAPDDWQWQDDFANYTPEQQQKLEASIKKLLDGMVDYAIPDLGL